MMYFDSHDAKKQLSKDFKVGEFLCKGTDCCGNVAYINPKLVNLLQDIRDHFDKPVKITSGYRCPKHNKEVGGVSNSQHTKGNAADIIVYGVHPNTVADYCEDKADGLGRYGDRFTHVDMRGYKARWNG